MDTGPITPPSHIGQRANGWNLSMQMPIFKGVLNIHPLANLLANGPPDDPPGIRKKAVCVSKRNAIHLARREVASRVRERPQLESKAGGVSNAEGGS